ncbi:calcium-binding protein [Thermococcus sp. 4557]|uniref:transglutaminase-like domain-containing protein n=1 Tax=Thermococcus sp. (strain CGMCC 1.5172 / 4557) TaxID=1042877 RepID=UPI000219EB98|nr:transglutaminase-like domain-containing protein [Thermococcus sp. 4557]AEK73996.1 calcium-binding protein [Thermococcus sp. 4557]
MQKKTTLLIVGVVVILLTVMIIQKDDHDLLSFKEELTTYKTDPFNPDTDGDGLLDGEEVKIYKTDPLNVDTDRDGLTDAEELKIHHTNPLGQDTDGDGLTDREELQFSTNPLSKDSDNDGLSDFDEITTYSTDPTTPDTDGDGLTDEEEIKVYFTKPAEQDTDGDGLTDMEEVRKYDTDPLDLDTDKDGVNDLQEITKNTDPHKVDTDNDGLTDKEEIFDFGTNPLSNDTDGDALSDLEELTIYNTDPSLPDTDGDGLVDSKELSLKTDPISMDSDKDGLTDGEEVLTYGTDPLKPDSDDDGLIDGEEVVNYKTNPLRADTDGDYLSDSYEIQLGTDPTYDWRNRYDEEAFRAGLSKYFREKLRSITIRFEKYDAPIDRAWAILKWINNTIQYDYTKSGYVDTIIYNWSKLTYAQRERYINLTRIYSPTDTAYYYKRGICTDYAILTAAMLLDSGISPVYLLDINYENSEIGHAAVAIEVEGELFILDQRLPMIPVGNYYWYWLVGNKPKMISNITFYEIKLDKNGEPEITNKWMWDGSEIKEKAYILSEKDLETITEITKQEFLKLYQGYQEDSRLEPLAEQDMRSLKSTGEPSDAYLPSDFTTGWLLWLHDESFWLYYHPITAQKVVEYWIVPIFRNEDWAEKIQQCHRFYLLVDYLELTKTITIPTTIFTTSDGLPIPLSLTINMDIAIPKVILAIEIAS